MGTPVVGLDCTLAIAGASYPALVQSTSPELNRALQPVVLATGDPNNSLAGYSPGQATAGFQIATYGFPDTANALLAALLSFTSMPVAMQFGSIGGIQIQQGITTQIDVTASTGGRAMEIRAAFECNEIPTLDGAASARALVERPFYWIDAIAATLLAEVHEDTSAFNLQIRRTLAKYYGRNPLGLPSHLRVTRQEASGTVDVILDDLQEFQKALDVCQALGDIQFGMSQTCFTSPATGGGVRFTVKDAIYDGLPKLQGDSEQFVSQQVPFKATRGVVQIAA